MAIGQSEVRLCYVIIEYIYIFIDGSYTKGTRAHTHRKLIQEWLWEPKRSSLERYT